MKKRPQDYYRMIRCPHRSNAYAQHVPRSLHQRLMRWTGAYGVSGRGENHLTAIPPAVSPTTSTSILFAAVYLRVTVKSRYPSSIHYTFFIYPADINQHVCFTLLCLRQGLSLSTVLITPRTTYQSNIPLPQTARRHQPRGADLVYKP